jgi:hypothetical protein
VALRFQQLHFSRRFGRSASINELVVDSRLIVWAYHSDCQENLFGAVLPNESSWQEMRAMGVGFWFTNTTQLRARVIFELLLSFFLLYTLYWENYLIIE